MLDSCEVGGWGEEISPNDRKLDHRDDPGYDGYIDDELWYIDDRL